MEVRIDPESGFCGGVIRAIDRAESCLHDNGKLFSLGAIVHNEEELERLRGLGLVTVDQSFLCEANRGQTLLVRAHGEPPSTFAKAERFGIRIEDCTCPMVRRLQKSIALAWERALAETPHGEVVIFGKVGHAEVLGLVGQTDGGAVVVEDEKMLENAIASGQLTLRGRVEVFSQTTRSPEEYKRICSLLAERVDSDKITVHDTICSQVASRHSKLEAFARSCDVVVFVSGKESSNGKVLLDLCRRANPSTYHVQSPQDVSSAWFNPSDVVGVCGATSTPKWLLEAVGKKILHLD